MKLKKLFGRMEEYMHFSHTMGQIYSVIKLIFTGLLVAHWIGCIWSFVGTYEQGYNSKNWIDQFQQVD